MPSQDREGGEWIQRVKGKQRVVLHRHVSAGRGACLSSVRGKDGESKSCLSSIVHRRELACERCPLEYCYSGAWWSSGTALSDLCILPPGTSRFPPSNVWELLHIQQQTKWDYPQSTSMEAEFGKKLQTVGPWGALMTSLLAAGQLGCLKPSRETGSPNLARNWGYNFFSSYGLFFPSLLNLLSLTLSLLLREQQGQPWCFFTWGNHSGLSL